MSSYVVYSDASATGCVALLDINGDQVYNKQWDSVEPGAIWLLVEGKKKLHDDWLTPVSF